MKKETSEIRKLIDIDRIITDETINAIDTILTSCFNDEGTLDETKFAEFARKKNYVTLGRLTENASYLSGRAANGTPIRSQLAQVYNSLQQHYEARRQELQAGHLGGEEYVAPVSHKRPSLDGYERSLS